LLGCGDLEWCYRCKQNQFFFQKVIFNFESKIMIKLLAAFVLGIVVATVGVTGIAQLADSGIAAIKSQSRALAQPGAFPESR
jgi:hypothetical protein